MTEQRERFIAWADKEFGRLPTLSMQICQTERFASYYKCFKAAEAPLLERIAELERQLAERKFVVKLPDRTTDKILTPQESHYANLMLDECAEAILAAGGEVR